MSYERDLLDGKVRGQTIVEQVEAYRENPAFAQAAPSGLSDTTPVSQPVGESRASQPEDAVPHVARTVGSAGRWGSETLMRALAADDLREWALEDDGDDDDEDDDGEIHNLMSMRAVPTKHPAFGLLLAHPMPTAHEMFTPKAIADIEAGVKLAEIRRVAGSMASTRIVAVVPQGEMRMLRHRETDELRILTGPREYDPAVWAPFRLKLKG